ncbi:hypothetical protein [Kribbella soli]|uniref:Uncharacterized protein n=1 Tax=Kribbella soli TaxID=1124743 RepID=A0A4R0H8I8_9ACTN|nr:hypothetical protein [Kribbella soli]TCC03979.1 hypothetical protein E0H45_33295 [Kribbella soli]
MPQEYTNEMFAGFGLGPDDPDRWECSPTFDFPATAAGTTVRCGLWVFQASEVVGRPIRLPCEIRSNGRPWNDTVDHTFPDYGSEFARAIMRQPELSKRPTGIGP